jgi:hypothetical protein
MNAALKSLKWNVKKHAEDFSKLSSKEKMSCVQYQKLFQYSYSKYRTGTDVFP